MEYAITLTLQKKCYRLTPEIQYDCLFEELVELTKEKKIKCSLIVELTKHGYNIHAHGFIHAESRKELHNIFRKTKYIGFICVKDIDDRTKWYDYTLKDYQKTKKELYCRCPLIKNDLKIYDLFKLNEIIES